jgi:hypothetical protein
MSVYLVAHQDDWQLFMEPLLSADLLDPTCKTVIIHLTAGDAGKADAYWQAREEAALQSVVFRLSELGQVLPQTSSVTVRGRSLRRDEIGPAVLYFLRLPDGNKDGKGFARQQYGSLEKLRHQEVTTLCAVDRLATYESFDDVVAQLRAMLDYESCFRTQLIAHEYITLSFPEYDPAISPGDHSDHYATGHLGVLIGSAKGGCRSFTHYACRHRQDYLAGNALFWKTGMFAVYHQTVVQACGYSTLGEQSHYQHWCTITAQYREL